MNSSINYEKLLVRILSEKDIKIEITDKSSLQKAQSLYSDLYVDLAFSTIDNEHLLVDMEDRLNKSINDYLMSSESSLYVSANQEIIVSPSAKNKESFQLTFFDKNGAIMDVECSTKDGVFKELKDNFCIPLRNEFSEFVFEQSNLNIEGDKNMQYVFELENIDLLVDRYKELLESEGLYSFSEINDFAENGFKNSKVDDIDYLLDDLNVSINDGTVVDLTYKSEILEMMDKDYSNFVQSLISIETNIIDKEVLGRIYNNYRDADNITLISPELYEDTQRHVEKKREGLLDKIERLESNNSSDTREQSKDDFDLEL